MLELKPFSPEVAAKVYELERGAAQGWTVADVAESLTLPQNISYGIWFNDALVGCLALERRDALTVSYHVAIERRTTPLPGLRALLWAVGEQLFAAGVARIVTITEPMQRAERRLAIYCGMTRETELCYSITPERLQSFRSTL